MKRLFIVLMVLSECQLLNAAEVQLSLRTAKNSYRLNEVVVFEFVFQNVSTKPLTLFPDPEVYYPAVVTFTRSDQSAKIVELDLGERSMDYKAWAKDAVILAPNKQYTWRLRCRLRPDVPDEWKEFLPADWKTKEAAVIPALIFAGSAVQLPAFGKYEVVAHYRFQEDNPLVEYIHKGPQLWFGELKSAPITIEVKEK